MPSRRTSPIAVPHPYAWIWEPLEARPTFLRRAMFGAQAVYLEGQIMLCFCTRAEPWRGLLACTERSHHESLSAEFPALRPHPVLSKWLYLPEASPDFDRTAERLVSLILRHDPRLGVIPPVKRRKSRS